MDKYTYSGTRVPAFVPKEFYEGYEDGRFNFKWWDNLYRYPAWKKALWFAGRLLAAVLPAKAKALRGSR